MAIPKIKEKNIIDALKYIDKNGIPPRNESTQYDLVAENGKRYPSKYVIAVANHLANGTDISTAEYNAIEAKNYLEKMGYKVDTKLEKYILTITAKSVTSTDNRFTMDSLGAGDNYKPLNVYFKKSNGEEIKRNYDKGERRISNQTMARIAFQIYEDKIASLSVEEKESFPTCRYSLKSEKICGIFTSVTDFRSHRNTIEYLRYRYGNGREFVIYCWNIFTTIIFVQECLRRFGEDGDSFILTYRDKVKKENDQEKADEDTQNNNDQKSTGYNNPYSQILMESKNIVFHGAPGTGKTHLAKEIAADIVSNGFYNDYTLLSDEQKKQVEFVQFHPSYDYTDFVEGLRPRLNPDGSMYFDRVDGIFKKFIENARNNYENSQKSKEVIEKEQTAQETLDYFLDNTEFGVDSFETIRHSSFNIINADNKDIHIYIPDNPKSQNVRLKIAKILQMLESGKKFEQSKDVTSFFDEPKTQEHSYYWALFKAINKIKKHPTSLVTKLEERKNYIFIIDEINRGEISKIFGELFFSIDPGYRGKAGEVSTQYANLHDNPNIKFYIPENVYIIGTMNDIDRSVDSFDFAMRRRFRFIEIKADDCLEMLDDLNNEDLKEEAIIRMTALNNEIAATEELNENYQIGAAYFLKLKSLTFDQLWTDYLQPLLKEYINGMYNEANIMKRFEKAYGYQKPNNENDYEETQNQG